MYLATGKTLLAKTLARFVNVPFVIADATTLTQVSLFLNFLTVVVEIAYTWDFNRVF